MNFHRLDNVRNTLIRLEDSVIFALIERAQFCHNPIIYEKGTLLKNDSFLNYFLHATEKVHGKFPTPTLTVIATVRRYTSPDEYAFTAPLPEPILPPIEFPPLLVPNQINMNNHVLDLYVHSVIPKICHPGDDNNYGSSATKDVEALQLISRRIHFGKFVAEAKYNDPKLHDQYVQLIDAKDKEGILNLLTDSAVEEKLLKRISRKAVAFGKEYSDIDVENATLKISSEAIVDIYRDFIIPSTKQVQVEYLLIRNQAQQSTLDSSLSHLSSA